MPYFKLQADGDRDSNELLELECLSDGSEYTPGNEYRRPCGILNCDEDIFLRAYSVGQS